MAHRYIGTAERFSILDQLARALASKLKGYSYTKPEEETYCTKLSGPDEATLYLTLIGDTNGDRINISGGFHIGTTVHGNPEFVRPSSGTPSDISLALCRGFDTIAREIKNRYLPKYLPALAQARKQRDETQAYRTSRLNNLQELSMLAGSTRNINVETARGYLQIGEVYGHISTTDTDATLELRCLTMEQARAVIKLLKNTKWGKIV